MAQGLYEQLIRPVLFGMDPEDAHDLALKIAPLAAILPVRLNFSADNLKTEFLGHTLANPVGLAAGFDKNGRFVHLLDRLGFGFAEIGSVCAEATDGNPRPRMFRLPADRAIVNRLGLNGDGAEAVAARLKGRKSSLPFGLNIAKTNKPGVNLQGDGAVEDVLKTFRAIRSLPLMYVTFNASCPNTHEGILQAKQELDDIIRTLQSYNDSKLPILIKVSPDSSDELLTDILETARTHNVAGFVCGNTTLSRQGLQTTASRISEIGVGGMSGAPLKERALAIVRKVAQMKEKTQVIVGCGGVATGADVAEYLQSGATVVQLYTSMVYQGPGTVIEINKQLHEILEKVAKQAS